VYGYRTQTTDGYEVGLGPGGQLLRFGSRRATTDALQFRVGDDGQVRSVQHLLRAPDAD
jgi:hypothetical protein